MIERTQYSYALLRYIHDPSTGEFVNVAIVVMSPKSKFLKFRFRKTTGRISDIFPDIRAAQFKRTLNTLERQYAAVSDAWLTPLDLENKEYNLEKLLTSVLPKDDSSLVWGPVCHGISRDLDDTTNKIYGKYVGKYDKKTIRKGRTDEEVWRVVRKELENRSISNFFEEKTIQGKSDEVQFDFAWKNGIWHCIAPLSFDLSAAETIRDKAHRCAGEIIGVLDSKEKFKVYFVVGEPSNSKLDEAYEKALGIFKNISSVEVYPEREQAKLFDKIKNQILAHESKSHSIH